MFRKSEDNIQFDAFSSIPNMLDKNSLKRYNNTKAWHNVFRQQVTERIDETIFSSLFDNTTGAPNSPIKILIGMMILKEAFGWSDSQLYEQCSFNLLVRSALGLVNMTDLIPVESTYYLTRKRIYDHQLASGEDLLEKTFSIITKGQVKDFNVNGQTIRMDSKIFGSNIAVYSRYEIILATLTKFYNSLDVQLKKKIRSKLSVQLEPLVNEEPGKTVYESTKDEIKLKLQPIGELMYELIKVYKNYTTEGAQLLKRVFNEQFNVLDGNAIELKSKEEISTSSVQSPHDQDSAFNNKNGNKIKGYRANITETCSDEGLNLITDTIVDKANVADTAFVAPAIEASSELTEQKIEKVIVDGGYQSPANDHFTDIDFVYTGIQGNSRFKIQKTEEGFLVIDSQTGEILIAKPIKKCKKSKVDRWYIIIDNKRYYFNEQAIRAGLLRHKKEKRPIEELHKRNNVEATIFQVGYHLKNQKSKYRGLLQQRAWVNLRCLWINLVRIMNFTKQTCQRTAELLNFNYQMLLEAPRYIYNMLPVTVYNKKIAFWQYANLFIALSFLI